jgi:hypothetical protein
VGHNNNTIDVMRLSKLRWVFVARISEEIVVNFFVLSRSLAKCLNEFLIKKSSSVLIAFDGL